MLEQQVNIRITNEAVNWLAELGYDPQFGARPVKRVIQKQVLNELSKQILAGKINKEKERARNKEAYERLKLNKVKYRQRLTEAYNNQVQRIQNIKADEEKFGMKIIKLLNLRHIISEFIMKWIYK